MTIRWPPGYGVSRDAVRHEFALTVRHRLDGDALHFAADAAAFAYPQRHTSCQQTEPGFAFNEGWAECWSGEYRAQRCADPGKLAVEGNVAHALAEFEQLCPDATRATMVDTLRRHPGAIHTATEFRARLPCTVPDPQRSSACSSVGDWCVAVALERGRTLLSLRAAPFRGRMRLTVDPPEGRATTRSFGLRPLPGGGPLAVEVLWSAHFPDRGKGTYRVRFSQPSSRWSSPVVVFER